VETIRIAEPDISGNELKYLTECIETNWISSSGSFVKKFEEKFAEYCGTKYATSCSNGTAALQLSLLALGVKKGDEVITPNLTFGATVSVIKHCNATPILADIDKKTWNISGREIERNITPKTKAIMPVHLYGNSCNMKEIQEIAQKYDLKVIEDAAEAHGAEYDSKKVGSIGDVGCFSFFGNKIITTGEGGICTSNDKELIKKIDLLKNHGMTKEKRYWHDVIGHNFRLTNIQAAIGLAQIEKIEEFNKKRDSLAKLYKENLKNLSEIEFQEITENSKPVYWMFPISLTEDANINVDQLAEKLRENGIETRKIFHPLHKMPVYLDLSEYPHSELVYKKGLILPMHNLLKEEQVNYICETLKKIITGFH